MANGRAAAQVSFNRQTAAGDWPAAAALAGRICLSAIFLISGVGKLAAPGPTIAYIESAGLYLPRVGYAIAVCIEILGGLALLTGYRVRGAASVLAVFSLAAAIAFHAHLADPNQFTHFLKNMAIVGGLLSVLVLGGGRYSLDARRASSRLPEPLDISDTTFASSRALATALRRAEAAHGEHEKRTGERDANWSDWYAEYLVAEQAGKPLPT
jgi:putative oxidoreductase